MSEKLRAELRAITEWSRETQLLRTQTEKDAVVIREIRRCEIGLRVEAPPSDLAKVPS